MRSTALGASNEQVKYMTLQQAKGRMVGVVAEDITSSPGEISTNTQATERDRDLRLAKRHTCLPSHIPKETFAIFLVAHPAKTTLSALATG